MAREDMVADFAQAQDLLGLDLNVR